jgi:vacuolar protein-sorting-associated protein 4
LKAANQLQVIIKYDQNPYSKKIYIEALRNKVKEYATDAVKCDKLEEYEKAFDLYLKAANQLQVIIKYDQNPYSKKIYIERAKEYASRAKEIKEKKLEKGKGGDGKGGDGKASEADEEKKKLEEQLSGCIVQEKPNVKWEDVAGLEKAKEALKEAVIFPIKFPQLFQGKRKPWKGILLYGPPGTGKSFLAKAAATETHGNFFSVSAANIVSKWMGESERLIKGLFDLARKNKPAVIFLDEIDSVMGARSDNENDATRRLKTEFLIQMQGVGNDDEGILVLGATNIPWALDPAVRRRFQKKIYISLPELDARKVMFELNLKGTPNTLTDDQLEDLARSTEGFSGSDISTLTQDAIFEPVRKCQSAEFFKKIPGVNGQQWNYVPCTQNEPGAMRMKMTELPDSKALLPPKVIYEDFKEALKRNKATVNKDDLKRQEDFTREFGQEG